MDNGIGSVIVALAIAVLIFLICRAIVLWYWRVNEGIALLKSIDEKLGRLVTQAPHVPAAKFVKGESEAAFAAWLAAQSPPLNHLSGEDRESYRQAWQSRGK